MNCFIIKNNEEQITPQPPIHGTIKWKWKVWRVVMSPFLLLFSRWMVRALRLLISLNVPWMEPVCSLRIISYLHNPNTDNKCAQWWQCVRERNKATETKTTQLCCKCRMVSGQQKLVRRKDKKMNSLIFQVIKVETIQYLQSWRVEIISKLTNNNDQVWACILSKGPGEELCLASKAVSAGIVAVVLKKGTATVTVTGEQIRAQEEQQTKRWKLIKITAVVPGLSAIGLPRLAIQNKVFCLVLSVQFSPVSFSGKFMFGGINSYTAFSNFFFSAGFVWEKELHTWKATPWSATWQIPTWNISHPPAVSCRYLLHSSDRVPAKTNLCFEHKLLKLICLLSYLFCCLHSSA